jgi:S1-C subfamily serine protease
MTSLIFSIPRRALACAVLLLAGTAWAQGEQLQDQIDATLVRVMPAVVQVQVLDGMGTGFLVGDGLVVTNHHVIAGNEDGAIGIVLHDGRGTTARVVHHEEHPDIAVLLLEEELANMPSGLKFADMRKARPGLLVLSIGHPGGLQDSISLGIVSAVGRPGGHVNEYFLQTDAAINSGNSGGPLVNLKGEVVGINTSKLREVGGQQMDGISFVLAGNIADRIVRDIQQRGRVVRPELGFKALEEVSGPKSIEHGVPRGSLVLTVIPGGAAAAAGLHSGDILTAIGGESVNGLHDFWVKMHRQEPGSQVKLSVTRESTPLQVVFPLLPRAAEPSWSSIGVELSQELWVRGVQSDSPFGQSGLRPGDTLLRFRAESSKVYQDLQTLEELKQAVQDSIFRKAPLWLMVKRKGRLVELKPADFSSRRGG